MATRSDIAKARSLARLLDTAVGVPGTPLRIGLDAVLGLVPGAGDMVAAALSGYIVLVAVRSGTPPAIVLRMLANIGIDTLVGSVPVLGDLFDVAYKSNIKNVELMERYADQPAVVEARTRRLGILVVIVIALLMVGIGLLSVLAIRMVWRAMSG